MIGQREVCGLWFDKTVRYVIMLVQADVRKVVVMGFAPLGCAPNYLWLHNSRKKWR
jgi:hypothetical protein